MVSMKMLYKNLNKTKYKDFMLPVDEYKYFDLKKDYSNVGTKILLIHTGIKIC